MDISDIYVKYFSRKYTVICSLVEHILSEDKKIAVWGDLFKEMARALQE